MSGEDATLVPPVGPDDHVAGPPDAALTVVEYGDYQCPYCGQAYPIVQRLQQVLGDAMRLVFRNMPLANVHPRATDAATFAEAAALQDRFWPMHDKLFENQRDLSDDALRRYAEEAGADLDLVDRDLASGVPQSRVHRDLESAIRSGANGTPTFFINGERYDGSWQLEPFLEHLEALRRSR